GGRAGADAQGVRRAGGVVGGTGEPPAGGALLDEVGLGGEVALQAAGDVDGLHLVRDAHRLCSLPADDAGAVDEGVEELVDGGQHAGRALVGVLVGQEVDGLLVQRDGGDGQQLGLGGVAADGGERGVVGGAAGGHGGARDEGRPDGVGAGVGQGECGDLVGLGAVEVAGARCGGSEVARPGDRDGQAAGGRQAGGEGEDVTARGAVRGERAGVDGVDLVGQLGGELVVPGGRGGEDAPGAGGREGGDLPGELTPAEPHVRARPVGPLEPHRVAGRGVQRRPAGDGDLVGADAVDEEGALEEDGDGAVGVGDGGAAGEPGDLRGELVALVDELVERGALRAGGPRLPVEGGDLLREAVQLGDLVLQRLAGGGPRLLH